MAFEHTLPDNTASWWRIIEVRNVRMPEMNFPGVIGNLFVQMGGFASEDSDKAFAIESFRIRYGADIPDPLPDTLSDRAVIRSDAPSDEQIEAAVQAMPMFAG